MKRRILNLAALLSLLLCLACLFMWVRSGFVAEGVALASGRLPFVSLESRHGAIVVAMAPDAGEIEIGPWEWRRKVASDSWSMRWPPPTYRSSTETLPSGRSFFALLRGASASTPVITVHHVILPYWLLTLVALALPEFRVLLWGWRQWNTNRCRKDGLCEKCGYDLRATPERCPECGTPAPATSRKGNDHAPVKDQAEQFRNPKPE